MNCSGLDSFTVARGLFQTPFEMLEAKGNYWADGSCCATFLLNSLESFQAKVTRRLSQRDRELVHKVNHNVHVSVFIEGKHSAEVRGKTVAALNYFSLCVET